MSDLPTLLPPNARSVERDLEQVMARLQGLSLPVSVLWNPDLCPENLLPYLAWALSVEDWDAEWPETVKRNITKTSVGIHRKKGTVGAVKDALAALGMDINLTEWFENGAAPHTFRLDVLVEEVFKAGFNVNPHLFSEVDRVIRNIKPVRSHYDMRLGERLRTDVFAWTGHRVKARESQPIAFDVPTRTYPSDAFVRTAERQVMVEVAAIEPIERSAA